MHSEPQTRNLHSELQSLPTNKESMFGQADFVYAVVFQQKKNYGSSNILLLLEVILLLR
jgi:hypothetical protein